MARHTRAAFKDADHVRLLQGLHQFGSTPVANRVKPPRVEALQDEIKIIRREVLLAELLLKVPDGKRHLSIRRHRSLVPVGVLLRVGNVRHNARDVQPNGEEEMPIGRDEPPLAVHLLGAEVPRCLKLRTRLPSAVTIPRGGGGFEGLALTRQVARQIAIRMDLFGPVGMGELPVLVDEGNVLLGRNEAIPLGLAFKAQVREPQFGKSLHLILIGPLHHELNGRDVLRVDDVGASRILRRTVDLGMRQQKFHRPLFAGIQSDARIDGTVLLEDGGRVVARVAIRRACRDVHRQPRLPRFREILDIHGKIPRLRKVRRRVRLPLEARTPFGARQIESYLVRGLLGNPRTMHGLEVIQ